MSNINPSQLNFEQVSSKLGSKTSRLEDALSGELETLDATNMPQLIEFQNKSSKLTMMYSLQSSINKTIKDTCQSTIQKLN